MSQVKNLVINYPKFLADYKIVCTNSYITKYGDEYLILGIRSHLSDIYIDIICSTDYIWKSIGSERYARTLEIAERISLIEDCDRLLESIKICAA